MIKKHPARILIAALCLCACSAVLVTPATASDPCDWGGDYPQADFSFEVLPSEKLPVTVQFTSAARSPVNQHFDSWRWNFDDGTTKTIDWEDRTEDAVNARHTFTTYQDHFDVCLKVTTICSKSSEACKKVEAYCTEPQAGYTVDVGEGPAPLTVHYTDTSEHTPRSVTSWVYKLDGSTISTARNFEHTFTTPGVYIVRQTVKKSCNPQSGSAGRSILVKQPVAVASFMDISFPTTTPTIAIVGAYLGNLEFVTTTQTTTTTSTTVTTTTTTTTTGAAAAGTTNAEPATMVPATVAGAAAASAGSTAPLYGTPPVPGTGTLSVITTPSGARIYVDDVLRGASPATVPDLAAGTHTLRLVREGYQTMTVPLEIPEGKITDYSTALVPESGTSMVSLPFIGGAVLVLVVASAGAYLYTKRKKIP